MPSYDAIPSHGLRNFAFTLIVLALIVAGAAWLRGGPPQIVASSLPRAIGAHKQAVLLIRSPDGVLSAQVSYRQDGRTLPVAAYKKGGRHWFLTGATPLRVALTLPLGRSDVPGLQDGPAQLVVTAHTANLRASESTVTTTVQVQSVPPSLNVLSGLAYVMQGSAAMTVYTAAGTAVRSGVQLGDQFFRGYALPGAPPGTHFCLWTFPFNAPIDTPVNVIAEDAAGNRAVAPVSLKVLPLTTPIHPENISDAFIQSKVMTIIARTPGLKDQGSPLQDFLLVNQTLRRQDAAALRRAAADTAANFYWHGAFAALPDAAVEAHFGDHRLYLYHGRQVDSEYHLGYDLASVRHAPIPAANAGRVVWTKYFGIYGNCVLLDHGYGLMSLYGHMNDFAVQPGEMVKKGQILGHTDSTGMAMGDHLHFSMLIDGVQTDPLQWWDPHWVQGHILQPLQAGRR